MKYEMMTVREAMQKISQNEIYLPAIQRKFVWDVDRIEKLFDSIMCGYPIGTFLFWHVEGKAKDDYTFYKFIQNFHERDRCWNEIAPSPDLKNATIGILDGQQRLNSMYVALQGTYAYRRKHGRVNDDAAYPERQLYLDLLHRPADDEENEVHYRFSFLSKEQLANAAPSECWFLVKTILTWDNLGFLPTAIRNLSRERPDYADALSEHGASLLGVLYQRLCVDHVISYFSIREQELDKITEIFVRVNSTGVQLSKTDLLFSSIVAHWNDGRATIENTIKTLNGKGNGFAFDNDFLMRACLALSDLPIVLKLNSFQRENIEQIKHQWPEIELSLGLMVDLLVKWGFSASTLPTLNAVIPIAYFIHKGGKTEESSQSLQQYLIRALLNQIFGSKTDRVLSAIREHLREEQGNGQFTLKSARFWLKDCLTMNLPENRSLAVDDEDIEEFLVREKGALAFAVLTLLYPHLRFDQVQFHQDHIHPDSLFETKKLEKRGLTPDEIKEWQLRRDMLPNLQLMEGTENESKRATPFATWIAENFSESEKEQFLRTNFIPASASWNFDSFRSFFEARKQLLRDELKKRLLVL